MKEHEKTTFWRMWGRPLSLHYTNHGDPSLLQPEERAMSLIERKNRLSG
jgi:hypothetical protein